jgi:hypothetical protein
MDMWCPSPIGTADYRHKLFDLATLICLAAGSNCMLDTVADVIPKYFLFNPPKGCPDGRDLRHDVDAVPVFLHHSEEPSDLTLDPLEPFGT